MYSIGGWTGEGNNVFPAHSIKALLRFSAAIATILSMAALDVGPFFVGS